MDIDMFDVDSIPQEKDKPTLTILADAGDSKAQYLLGKYYATNEKYEDAYYWIQKSANQGYVRGINALGICFGYGYGVKQNAKKAFSLYKIAADQGLPLAQRNVGMCFWDGNGIEKDETQSLAWYLKAAHGGDAISQNAVGIILIRKKRYS